MEERRTEDDLVSLLPHVGHCERRYATVKSVRLFKMMRGWRGVVERLTEGLSRVDDTCESDLDVLVLAKRLEHVLASDTERAQSVED